MKNKGIDESLGVGETLRHRLLNRITPLLLDCGQIPGSVLRLKMQAHCLDLVNELESAITSLKLDGGSRQGTSVIEDRNEV